MVDVPSQGPSRTFSKDMAQVRFTWVFSRHSRRLVLDDPDRIRSTSSINRDRPELPRYLHWPQRGLLTITSRSYQRNS